jgi:hypothetical protein
MSSSQGKGAARARKGGSAVRTRTDLRVKKGGVSSARGGGRGKGSKSGEDEDEETRRASVCVS